MDLSSSINIEKHLVNFGLGVLFEFFKIEIYLFNLLISSNAVNVNFLKNKLLCFHIFLEIFSVFLNVVHILHNLLLGIVHEIIRNFLNSIKLILHSINLCIELGYLINFGL